MRSQDQVILPKATRLARGYHIATEWYLRGWVPLPYQYAFHQYDVLNVTFVAGIAAGKSWGVAASFLIDCLSIPYFRALNTSVTAKQATLVFDMVEAWLQDNPRLEELIENVSLRPYPTITFKNYSEWEFRTAGTDARFIRGSEYDRINFDECGLDHTGGIAKVLRGRLRGKRPDGSIRMARLDCITSPTDAPWLRERFERGDPESPDADLGRYRSMRVETYDNTHLTREQIKAMEADYPPEMIDVELRGFFPDYGFSMFPSGHVNACVDTTLYDEVVQAVFPEGGPVKPGYTLAEDPRHGIIKYEKPARPNRIYVMGGDPGIENFPKRNTPVVVVADVTDNNNKEIVYFDWISGKGSYNPFLTSYKYAIQKYDPVLRGIDATGPQKALDELGFENFGIKTDRLNFASDKTAMLNALSVDITNHRWKLPPIAGMKRQLGEYNLERDKKIAQDIVMALAEVSHLARFIPAQRDEKSKKRKNNYRSGKRTSIYMGRK